MNKKELLQRVTLLHSTVSNLVAELEAIKTALSGETQLTPTTPKPQPNKLKIAKSLPSSELGPTPDYKSDKWPVAAPQHMIVKQDNPHEQRFRALQVVTLLQLDNSHKKILDFGCGDGMISKELKSKSELVVGYDLASAKSWDTVANDFIVMTKDKADVQRNAPYDLIMLFDVIDHLVGEDPIEVMKFVKSVLAPGGRIYVKTHPWTAKHGSHLYETINKAYLHLALTTDELLEAGYTPQSNMKFVRPMATYLTIFSDAGLEVASKNVVAEAVDPFFTGDVLDRIIKINWEGKIDKSTAIKIMSNQFIDYWLVSQQ